MTVTLYTITSCPYCQQEKEYLRGKSIAFDEIILDQQKDKLAEFKTVGSGFSGVPLIVVVHDDGSKATVKGFDQTQLDQALGAGAAQSSGQTQPPTASGSANSSPVAGVAEPAPQTAPVQAVGEEPSQVVAPASTETNEQIPQAQGVASEPSPSPDTASAPPVSPTDAPQPPQNDGSVT